MKAAENGHDKCVQLLINNGADITLKNNDGKTALQIAKDWGYQNCVKLLKV